MLDDLAPALHLADAARPAAAGPVRPVANTAVLAQSMLLLLLTLAIRFLGGAAAVSLRNVRQNGGLVVARHNIRMGAGVQCVDAQPWLGSSSGSGSGVSVVYAECGEVCAAGRKCVCCNKCCQEVNYP